MRNFWIAALLIGCPIAGGALPVHGDSSWSMDEAVDDDSPFSGDSSWSMDEAVDDDDPFSDDSSKDEAGGEGEPEVDGLLQAALACEVECIRKPQGRDNADEEHGGQGEAGARMDYSTGEDAADAMESAEEALDRATERTQDELDGVRKNRDDAMADVDRLAPDPDLITDEDLEFLF